MKEVEVPSQRDLELAYEAIQWKPDSVAEKEFVKWAQWSRIDARLGELLVDFLIKNFSRLNPFQIFLENSRTKTPQVVLVILEFARIKAKMILTEPDHHLFQVWCTTLETKTAPAPFQSFMVPSGFPRPEGLPHLMIHSLRPYVKWGFVGLDNLAPAKHLTPSRRTLLPKPQRLAILKNLLSSRSYISVNDYIQACDGRVHRRAAERDLAAMPKIKSKGKTRGKRYQVKKS